MNYHTTITMICMSILIPILDSISAEVDENISRYGWVRNPVNGHFYAEIDDVRITWNDSRVYAEQLGGYIVSINDEQEDEWLYNLYYQIHSREIRIGIFYENNEWKWDSGEPLTYSNWNPNGWGGENAVLNCITGKGWYSRPSSDFLPFIVERETLLPSPETEYPTLSEELIWFFNPVTSHYYAITESSNFEYMTWEDSRKLAKKLGGYIVSINDPQENIWVYDQFSQFRTKGTFIGLYRENNIWKWDSGEPITFSNFYFENQIEDYSVVYYEYGTVWYESSNSTYLPCIIEVNAISSPSDGGQEIDLNEDSLEENQIWEDALDGYKIGDIQVGSIPNGTGTDGKGLRIQLDPGEGVWILSSQVFNATSAIDISGSFQSTNNNIYLALIGLNSPIDGQFAYTNITGQEIPVDNYRQLHLLYEPPSSQIQIAIQAVNPHFSSFMTTIYIDSLKIKPYIPEENENTSSVPLEVDGSFDFGTQNLIVNINNDDGIAIPFFQSLSDIAIRMFLNPENRSVNVGSVCQNIYDQLPFRLLGGVNVQRDSLPGGGTVSLILTNGLQNLGVFRHANNISDIQNSEMDTIWIGGDFTANNTQVPIGTFVQLGGPQADTSIIIDDLTILKNLIVN